MEKPCDASNPEPAKYKGLPGDGWNGAEQNEKVLKKSTYRFKIAHKESQGQRHQDSAGIAHGNAHQAVSDVQGDTAKTNEIIKGIGKVIGHDPDGGENGIAGGLFRSRRPEQQECGRQDEGKSEL